MKSDGKGVINTLVSLFVFVYEAYGALYVCTMYHGINFV